jgi:hypothetical protein
MTRPEEKALKRFQMRKLKDSSLDLEVIGDKSAYSFTIDMNESQF